MTGCSVPATPSYLVVSFLNMETIEVSVFSYISGG